MTVFLDKNITINDDGVLKLFNAPDDTPDMFSDANN